MKNELEKAQNPLYFCYQELGFKIKDDIKNIYDGFEETDFADLEDMLNKALETVNIANKLYNIICDLDEIQRRL